jgi:hypothetical protein
MHSPNPKKLVIGSGATAALLGAFLMGGVALNHVSAASLVSSAPSAVVSTSPSSAPATAPSEAPNPAEASEPALNPAQVKTTADQARAAALAKFPGATVTQVELQDENGALVWGVELTDASGAVQDVKVDGNSGQIVSTQADGAETPGTAEAPGAAETPETPGAAETGN